MKLKALFATILSVALVACGNWTKDLNIFPVSEDINLGLQVSGSIDSQYQKQLIDSSKNVQLYKYLYSLRDSILKTGLLTHAKDFKWRLRIIHDDTTQNAFCTPGGYIYVYTGLMKYLESEDQLAGVMGHEMAHAEKRHSTDAMTREYGAQLLLDMVFGKDKGQLARVATGIAQLSYGRDAESEADNCSVEWLYKTSYNAIGAAGFFEKIEREGKSGGIPEFLSTHPNPNNRIQNMKKRWAELGGKTGQTYAERYAKHKQLLP